MFRSMLSLSVLAVATAAFAAPQDAPKVDHPAAAPAKATRSPIKPGDRLCIRDTGSLIPAKKGECLPVPGRSYSKDDIDATGEQQLGPALQKLDPAITTHGNGY